MAANFNDIRQCLWQRLLQPHEAGSVLKGSSGVKLTAPICAWQPHAWQDPGRNLREGQCIEVKVQVFKTTEAALMDPSADKHLCNVCMALVTAASGSI